MKANKRYQLRHAAGRYWLLDMEQEGLIYKKPIELNECAALIWKLLEQGKTRDEIAEEIHEEYGISIEQAREDTKQLIVCLREQGLT